MQFLSLGCGGKYWRICIFLGSGGILIKFRTILSAGPIAFCEGCAVSWLSPQPAIVSKPANAAVAGSIILLAVFGSWFGDFIAAVSHLFTIFASDMRVREQSLSAFLVFSQTGI